MALTFSLNDREKAFLGNQALRSIATALEHQEDALPAPPPMAGSTLEKPLGSFVTLTKNGSLRGCIGTIVGRDPLYINVWQMARAAAFQDYRFPPLQPAEWKDVNMEITVLDQPSPCPDPQKIVIGRDGLILSWRGRNAVFLPQVPVEQGWNLDEYLTHLCYKGNMPNGTWASPEAQLFWYQALPFPVNRDA